MPIRTVTALIAALSLAACATTGPVELTRTPTASTPTAVADARPFLDRALRDGDVYIAAQPTATDFAGLEAAGITRIFNLRTAEEMQTAGIDGAELAAAHGMRYAQSPVAGAAGFTPAVLEAFAREMESGSGPMLLHCGSGARAGNLYAAWLVRYRGLTPAEAMARVEPLGLWPLPMARLLGETLTIDYAEPTGKKDSFEVRTGQ
jgi:uncharacterized protein (TIGR01244 family)